MGTVISTLSFEDALQLDWRIRAVIARRAARAKDVLLWNWAIFPDKFGLEFCHALHDYMVAVRHDPLSNLLAPRYHSKTTVSCFGIPMFQACEEPASFLHYLQVQSTDTKANSVNRSIKAEFEENELLYYLYGDQIGARWTDEQFVLKNGVCFSAVGAGQSIRGINYRNRRPDNFRVDDLFDEKDIRNPEGTMRKREWFWSTLYPARAQGRKTVFAYTGTAVNDSDLSSQLIKLPNWTSRIFRAITDWEKKTVLWPEKNTFESLMLDKAGMTTSIFMREMQNEIQDDSESLVKRAWIHEYDPALVVAAGNFEYVRTVLGCDPSIGQKEENDYTGISLIDVFRYTDSRELVYYIRQLWNEHLSLDSRIKKLQSIYDQQPHNRRITIAYIEGISGFKDFVAEVKRRTSLPVREIDKVLDKLATLESKAWHFESGRVFINKHLDPVLKDEWITQMCTNHPKHDDMRDATLLPIEMNKVSAMAYAD